MFAKTICLSDAFLDMPLSARCLYFTLGLLADDDGFINSPKSVMRQCGASQDDLSLLLTKKFVLAFDTGVIVIKHWRINNYLRSDRYQCTKYQEEKAQLETDENGAYRYTSGIPGGIPRLGKDRIIGKDRIEDSTVNEINNKYIISTDQLVSRPQKHKHGEYKNVLLTDEEYEKLKTEFPTDYQERIERLSSYIASTGKSYKSHLATIRNWARMDKERHPQTKSPINDSNHFDDLQDWVQEVWKK